MSDTSRELHQASLLRNSLLSRAVSVINSLQHDTDNLVVATELEHDSPSHLTSASAFGKIEAGKGSASAPISTPVIKIPARFRKSSAASTANTDHAYQQIMHDAAEQRNLLLKRAYDVTSNLQSDVDGLVEEVTITAAVAPDTPSSPPKPGQPNLSASCGANFAVPGAPIVLTEAATRALQHSALLVVLTSRGGDLTDIMRTAAATSAAAARLRARAEQAQTQAQEAEGAQQHTAEEEGKAARLAQQAEQRAKQEQVKGNLPAAVAASSTAARIRKAASSAQAQLRQLKARADLKGREAQDSFALASAAEQKAQALEAAGLVRAGAFSPLPHSPAPYSPQSLPTPAMLRGLAGDSRAGSKGWLGRPDEATSQQRLSVEFGAAPGSPIEGAVRSLPGTPGDQQGKAVALEGVHAQALLLQATWGRLQAAAEAAEHSEQQQASAVAAGQQAQQAAAQVAHTHQAANKAKAEAGKLAAQASRLREAGKLEEAKKAQIQAKRSQQAVAQAEQAVAAAEQVEKEAAAAAQAAAAASFAAEAKAEELTGVVKQLQEATEAGVLAMSWKKKAHGAAHKAVEVREAAVEYTAQACAASQRATAAEQEAHHLEAQGKFADAAAAALQADRWQKAAGDASKQAVKLQAEAKAAASQSYAAQAAAMQAKHLATCLKMTTGHLQAVPSTAQASSASHSAQPRPQTPTLSRTDAQRRGALTRPSQLALQPRLSAPLPKGKAPRASVTASPSRLSRMTLQDTPAAEDEESASEQGRAVQRAGSVLTGPSDETRAELLSKVSITEERKGRDIGNQANILV